MFVAQKSVMSFSFLSGIDFNQAPKYHKLVILDMVLHKEIDLRLHGDPTKNQNVQLRNKHMSKIAVACSEYHSHANI